MCQGRSRGEDCKQRGAEEAPSPGMMTHPGSYPICITSGYLASACIPSHSIAFPSHFLICDSVGQQEEGSC